MIILNSLSLSQLQSAVLKYPVVILPSHRSYLDFILVSYFLLEFNIQLPAIAAGQGQSTLQNFAAYVILYYL